MKTLTKAFNIATVRKGETFRIDLDANPSTGYLWGVWLASGKASLVSREYTPAAPAGALVVGGGGVESFIFKVEDTGVVEVVAEYRRPWEKATPAAETNRFRIKVV